MPCDTVGMTSEDPRERRAKAGQWLRDRRQRAGYRTAAEFARALGIDKGLVSNYETGRSDVPDDRAERIAEVLGIDIITVRRHFGLWVPKEAAGSVMDRTEAMLDENERLAREIRELAARERRAVEAFIEALKEPAETSDADNENRR